MNRAGKSTIIEGLQAAFGEQRCGLLGLSDIEKSRFALTNIPGKTLVVSTEQPSSFISTTSVLNRLISGERIAVERKYSDPFEIAPRAKILWAMNDLPRIADANDGIFRRVKVIAFPARNEAAQDVTVKERVKREGPGILNWALAGLERLRTRGRFVIPQSVKDASAEFQVSNDTESVFVADRCATGNDSAGKPLEVRSSDLYQEYRTWCETNGHKAKSSTAVANDWKRIGFTRIERNTGSWWIGVGLIAKSIDLNP